MSERVIRVQFNRPFKLADRTFNTGTGTLADQVPASQVSIVRFDTGGSR